MIKLNLIPNPIYYPSPFHLYPFCFLGELFYLFVNDGWNFWVIYLVYERCWSVPWKGVSSVGFHSFQPFDSPLQMPIVTRVNLAILTSNHIFPNKKGLERLEKFVPKKESSIRKFIIFKTPKKTMFKLCSKKNNLKKRFHPKKVVKVEKGEAKGDE